MMEYFFLREVHSFLEFLCEKYSAAKFYDDAGRKKGAHSTYLFRCVT